jgi:hypothetical protein
MSFGPHPRALAVIAEQHRADVVAQVDQLRLVKLVQPSADRRQPWLDLATLRVVAPVLALFAAFQRGS